MPSMPSLPIGVRYMLVSTAAFSAMNVCVKALVDIPAYEIICFRVGISLLLTYGLIVRQGVRPRLGRARGWLLLRGAAGGLALWFYFITIKQMPIAVAVALQYMSPLFGAALAPLFVDERMGARQWSYFLISFAGVAAMARFEVDINWLYVGLGLVSAFLTGVTTNAIRRSRATEHPLVVMLYLPLFAFPASAPYTATHWVAPVGWQWVWLVLTGLFTQVNQFYTTKALQADRLDRITYWNYLGLVYAVVLGYFIFGEGISLGTFGAMCLIVGGVLLNVWHNYRAGRRKGLVEV